MAFLVGGAGGFDESFSFSQDFIGELFVGVLALAKGVATTVDVPVQADGLLVARPVGNEF